MPPHEPSTLLISIGALARATGVPPETLRTWERRYGVPKAQRTASGHRRYPVALIGQLRLVARAIEAGHKASVALVASSGDLRDLLGPQEETQPFGELSPSPASGLATGVDRTLERCLVAVRNSDPEALDRELRHGWHRLGALGFVQRVGAPLLTAIGDRWEQGALGVRHEHFASERLRDFLTQQWRPLSDGADGPAIVCATLPGERHVLGLELAAAVAAVADCSVVFLGADVPVDEIAEAAAEHLARAVVLSASAASDPKATQRAVRSLLGLLPRGVTVLVGGSGFEVAETRARRLPDFASLYAQLAKLPGHQRAAE